jgi:hypothetical protein
MDPALEILAQLPLDIPREATVMALARLLEKGLEMVGHQPVQERPFRTTWLVPLTAGRRRRLQWHGGSSASAVPRTIGSA